MADETIFYQDFEILSAQYTYCCFFVLEQFHLDPLNCGLEFKFLQKTNLMNALRWISLLIHIIPQPVLSAVIVSACVDFKNYLSFLRELKASNATEEDKLRRVKEMKEYILNCVCVTTTKYIPNIAAMGKFITEKQDLHEACYSTAYMAYYDLSVKEIRPLKISTKLLYCESILGELVDYTIITRKVKDDFLSNLHFHFKKRTHKELIAMLKENMTKENVVKRKQEEKEKELSNLERQMRREAKDLEILKSLTIPKFVRKKKNNDDKTSQNNEDKMVDVNK
jgi:hypothetical protein